MSRGAGTVTTVLPPSPTVVVVECDAQRRTSLAGALGPGTVAVASVDEMRMLLSGDAPQSTSDAPPLVVVSGPSLPPDAVVPHVADHPRGVVVAVHGRASTAELRAAMAAGVGDLVGADAPAAQLRHAVRRAGLSALVVPGADPPGPGRLSPVPFPSVRPEVFPSVEADPRHGGEGRCAPGGGASGGIVAVLAPKGGVGGTTVAVNLAVALAVGAPAGTDDALVAAVVDADLQFGDAALLCGVDPIRSVASLHRGALGHPAPTPDGTSVGRALLRVPDTAVALLAAPVDPALAETVPAGFLAQVLDALCSLAAWVVVDLPSIVDDRVVEVLDRSCQVVIVASPDPLALKNARAGVDLLERLGLGDRWSVVCNAPTAHAGVGVGAVEQHLGRRVRACIPHDANLPAAVVRGRPVVVDAPTGPSAVAFLALADTLRTPGPPDATPASSLRHVVDRLVGGARRVRRPEV